MKSEYTWAIIALIIGSGLTLIVDRWVIKEQIHREQVVRAYDDFVSAVAGIAYGESSSGEERKLLSKAKTAIADIAIYGNKDVIEALVENVLKGGAIMGYPDDFVPVIRAMREHVGFDPVSVHHLQSLLFNELKLDVKSLPNCLEVSGKATVTQVALLMSRLDGKRWQVGATVWSDSLGCSTSTRPMHVPPELSEWIMETALRLTNQEAGAP